VANVDDKVVAMSFENSRFESGVSKTLSTLDKLKAALKFDGAGKGLSELEAASKGVTLSHISDAIDSIKERFTALKVIGLQVLANIATKALSAGAQFVKSFTFQPVMDGLKEYETNLNAVQTILANTQASGAKLKDVNSALQQLNTYSDKTIYNFSQMAKNIGTFTAAGVDLKTSTAAIKGIANLAALSGSNSEQASTAMYQLSQAISAGRVSLQDWNSVVNAGMGGTVFQRALAQTAERMGTLKDGAVQLSGKMKNVTIDGQSFRESITAKPGEESWLTSKVLTNTLKQFTGDMTDAELAAQGFNKAQIKAIQAQATTAMKAATEVKTLSGVLDTAKESAGSGWAQTWQIIFGDFGEAKTLFTNVSNAINGFIGASANARNKVLGDWKALGGRTALIEAIKNVFEGLASVVKPIKEAFRDIFPATTGKQLFELTERFKSFTETLKIGPDTANNLKRSFRGLFAVLDIGKQLIGGVFTVLGKLFGTITSGSGGFLNLTGNIGDFLVSVDEALRKGGKLHAFFEALGTTLAAPIKLLGLVRDAIVGIFTGFDEKSAGGISKGLGDMTAKLQPSEKVIEGVRKAWEGFLDTLGKVGNALKPAVQAIADLFTGLGPTISDAIKNTDFGGVLEVIKVGLLGGIFLTMKKFFSGTFAEGLGGGVLSKVGESFEALTGSLQAMQTSIKASALLKIAGAVALLTASVVALSFIDKEKLNSSLTAMTIAFGQLLGAMAILTNVSKSAGFIKLPFVAASLILLAGAIDVLVLAVLALSHLNWEELAKGLGGVAGLLVAISAAAGPLSRNSAGMITAGVGIGAIAVAMKILASAVKDFGQLEWEQIGKGLASVAGLLVVIGGAANLFPTGMLTIGIGLIGIAVALKLLASSVEKFGGMEWKTILKGLVSIGGAIAIIGLAMQAMPANMVLQAAGLLLVSIALKGIAKAIGSFGGMSIGEIAKGLGTLAAALGILAISLTAMTLALPGAFALGIAAAGLTLLVPALKSMGEQSWGEIVKGLVSLAAAFVLLGAAGIVLAPVAPALLALGVAMLAIGAGLALAGAGIALIGVGLSAIAISGPVAIGILVKALIDFAEAIPRVIGKFVDGLVDMINHIAQVAPQFVAALGKILTALANAVIIAAPRIAAAFTALVQAALKVLRDNFPILVETGFQMLISLLKGIRDNIAEVTTMVVDIVTTFLTTLTGKLPQIITAGANALAALLKGVANNIRTVVSAAADVVVNFVGGIANNLGKVTTAAADLMAKFVASIVSFGARLVSAGAELIVKFISGVGDKAVALVVAAREAIGKFINAVATEAVKLGKEGADAIINFLNGTASAIREKGPQLRSAGANLASAIIDGLVDTLSSLGGRVVGKLVDIASGALNAVKKKLGIHSPSREFAEVGKQMMQGLILGVDNHASQVNKSLASTADDLIDTMVKSLSAIPDALDGVVDLNPVITPVLDLSSVQSGAKQLGGILSTTPISPTASLGQANTISAQRNAAQTVQEGSSPDSKAPEIKFEQNNYSPKALSEVEIYRNTKNQMALLKRALPI
jgi:tape measure domain-containing protein